MTRRATSARRPNLAIIAALSGTVLSGCVSSTIDTSGNFTANTVNASDVLALTPADAIPTPASRPESGSVAAFASDPQAQADQSREQALATVDESPAMVAPEGQATTEVAAAAEPTPPAPLGESSDVANSRIISAQNAPVAGGEAVTQVASAPPAPVAPVAAAAAPRSGFLNSLFGRKPQPRAPVPQVAQAPASEPAAVEPARPVIVASASAAPQAPRPAQPVIATASARGTAAGLPGVNRERALGIAQTDDADDEEGGSYQVASAGGLARLAPNGLRTQHAGVDVACLKPALVRVLKTVERKYGRPAVITSGYRSPNRNARARGAKNSLHMYCAAADIQVEGVSKWKLAAFLRELPGRGGVGTYCHTNSVHIDIGPTRDWNWRCKRKS